VYPLRHRRIISFSLLAVTLTMSKTESAPRSYKLMSLLAVIGFGVSCVTLYEYVIYARGLASGPSFCNISKQVNCEAVNASKWSYFLGLPIASYGVFFYLALLGLLRKAAALGAPLNKPYERVILLATVVAALLSVGLFLLSKFVIGALCILCIALYLVNFTMLWSWWQSTARGVFMAGIGEGIAGIIRFIRAIFSGDNAAVKGGVLLALLAGISALAPELVYRFEASKIATSDGKQRRDQFDHVGAWRAGPLEQPKVVASGGAAGDYVKGEPGAPIEIVEFADFECPACRITYRRLEQLLGEYSGKYRLVFKNYPLDADCNPGIESSFHQQACFAANLTRCAGEQGRFWESLDLVFNDPSLEGDEREVEQTRAQLFDAAARSLGLDQEALRECVDSKRYYAKIRDDITDGNRLGLTSTPTFFVNGRRVARPTEEGFKAIFSAILK
jgi:protein-disulfide isomerase/uncharacterized membrane protein